MGKYLDGQVICVGVATLLLFGGMVLVPWIIEQDRQDSERIQQDGYEAGKAGLPVESNPYYGSMTMGGSGRERDWKEGWCKGYLERQREQKEPPK